MIKLESLKKSDHFKQVLNGKKIHTNFYSIFATKNFLKSKKNTLLISFITKKKIGNAVKRNRIRRKLKAITGKILKIKGDFVKRGQKIASIGSSGRVTGPHLHFATIVYGIKINPLIFLK